MRVFPRHPYAVVNPKAGLGKARSLWLQLQEEIEKEIGSFPWDWTGSPRQATSLVRSALQQECDLIISVGGDGTHNEVINGFFADGIPVNSRASLTVFTCGSGADFNRTLGITDEIAAVLHTILSGREREVDVGRLEFTLPSGLSCQRLFLNIASLGLSARVNKNLSSQPRFLGGSARFLLATVQALLENHNETVSLEVDGKTLPDQVITMVAAANGQFFGGGMRVAPHAQLDDGLLDLVVIGAVGLKDLIRWGLRFYQGRHLTHPRVQYHQAHTIRALSEAPVLVEADGETLGSLPANFTILPRAVRLLVP
jgi:YegS/Rv2252/BmrU family lipid kinase